MIELRLGGARTRVPGSIVEPLLDHRSADVLPLARAAAVGRSRSSSSSSTCSTGSSSTRRSGAGLPASYASSQQLFDRIAVSDIAWGRGRLARGGSRRSGRRSGRPKTLSVTGPKADALLLAGWLRSRLKKQVELTHRLPRELERVAVDGEAVAAAAGLAADAERPPLGRARRVRPRPDLRGRGQRSPLRSNRPFDETARRSARRPPRR